MTWFETLTGFDEKSPEQVRENLTVDGEVLKSRVNDGAMNCGFLEIPRLADLRQRVQAENVKAGKIAVREVVADVQELHRDKSNADSLFQVASQFNLLEMVSPTVTPDDGVGGYEYDHTQGPACAIAAGAGTIYRNYFALVNGQIGQSAENQIDCLGDMGAELGNTDNHLWEMSNGYALASESGLKEISKRLESSTESEIDLIRQLLRIGIQWDTEVTISESRHRVSQAYCSALPVAYSRHSSEQWAAFAQLVLEASYEAMIIAGILNYLKTMNSKLFLTLIGGGAFGNKKEWIIGAIQRALKLYENIGLDIVFVSYGRSDGDIQGLIEQFPGG